MARKQSLSEIRARALGRIVFVPGQGDLIVTRFVGEKNWPCFRKVRDPKYFGDFVLQSETAVEAAMKAGKK
jgi:hypothetical protein